MQPMDLEHRMGAFEVQAGCETDSLSFEKAFIGLTEDGRRALSG